MVSHVCRNRGGEDPQPKHKLGEGRGLPGRGDATETGREVGAEAGGGCGLLGQAVNLRLRRMDPRGHEESYEEGW